MNNLTSLRLLAVALFLCTATSIVLAQISTKGRIPSPEKCLSCDAQQGVGLPDLGTAASFGVLGAAEVTSTGPTIITGNLGVSPGTSITGAPTVFSGTIYPGGSVAATAQADALAAFNDLNLSACTEDLTGQNLGGLTLTPGTYCFDSTAQLTGILTLNALGDPNAVFIFKIGSTLTTATGSSVVLINSARACNVYFAMGSSATVGLNSSLRGNLIAFAAITLTTGATLTGRAIALTEAVTMDSNTILICNFGVSAASVSVGGRVVNRYGRAVSRANLTLNENGVTRSILTNSFGYYRFTNVAAGETVFLQIQARGYTFAEPSRALSLFDSVSDADFIAN